MALKYIGKGAFLPVEQVPARDLSDDEVKEFGGEVALLKTGLYEKVKKSKAEETAKEGE